MSGIKAALAAATLGGFGDVGDYDDAGMFGMDEFGQPTGVSPLWGAVAGPGVASLATVGVRQFTSMDKHAELIGLGAAAVAMAPMIIMKKTRFSGWVGLLSAVASQGPRIVEALMSDKQAAKDTVGKTITDQEKAGIQSQIPPTTPGKGPLSAVEIQRAYALGMVMPQATGALGASHPELPTLVGTAFGQAQRDLQILGGPQLSDLATRFGSTHFNKA